MPSIDLRCFLKYVCGIILGIFLLLIVLSFAYLQYLYCFWTPTHVDDIWATINSKEAKLDRLVASNERLNGRIDGAFELSIQIYNLVDALPKHSPKLSHQELAEVIEYSKKAHNLGEQLSNDGEVNDKIAVKSEWVELKSVLSKLRGFYPLVSSHLSVKS